VSATNPATGSLSTDADGYIVVDADSITTPPGNLAYVLLNREEPDYQDNPSFASFAPVSVELEPLTLPGASINDSMLPGDVVAPISNGWPGSVFSIAGPAANNARLAVSGSNLVVGAAGPGAANSQTGAFSITETTALAYNSPRVTSFSSLTVGSGSSLSITLTPTPAQSSWDLPQVAGVSIANAPEGLVLSVVSPNFAIRGHG
jgi:hypothetical protein